MNRCGDYSSDGTTGAPKRIRRALALLFSAHELAVQLATGRWDFAIKIATLRELGLTGSDFRWLACKGLVEHAREVTLPGDPRRQFQPQGEGNFSARTCFVLAEAGVAEARRLQAARKPAKPAATTPNHSNHSPVAVKIDAGSGRLSPRWDAARRELRFGPHLIKAFRSPSPNQEMILTVFEEEGWPSRIDDPLPPHPEMLAQQRLHDTLKSLNRNQHQRLIRFVGDGTGQGVCWEPASEDGCRPASGVV